MRSVEKLAEALAWAQQMGYHVRHEYLGGTGGGCCEVGGKRILFVDLALSAAEQLDHVVDALWNEGIGNHPSLPKSLRPLAQRRKAA